MVCSLAADTEIGGWGWSSCIPGPSPSEIRPSETMEAFAIVAGDWLWRVEFEGSRSPVELDEPLYEMLMGEDGAIRWRTCPETLISAASMESSAALTEETWGSGPLLRMACTSPISLIGSYVK